MIAAYACMGGPSAWTAHFYFWLLLTTTTTTTSAAAWAPTAPSQWRPWNSWWRSPVLWYMVHHPCQYNRTVNNRPNLQPRQATPTNGTTPPSTSYYLLHPIHPWHSTDTRTYGQNWSDLICSGLAACKCVCGACTYVCVDIHSVVSMQAQMHPWQYSGGTAECPWPVALGGHH